MHATNQFAKQATLPLSPNTKPISAYDMTDVLDPLLISYDYVIKHVYLHNLKKRARLISRSRKYIFQYFERHGLSSSGYVCEINLALFLDYLLCNFLLIRSFTTGSVLSFCHGGPCKHSLSLVYIYIVRDGFWT